MLTEDKERTVDRGLKLQTADFFQVNTVLLPISSASAEQTNQGCSKHRDNGGGGGEGRRDKGGKGAVAPPPPPLLKKDFFNRFAFWSGVDSSNFNSINLP